jgi:hypothetical protein
MTFTRSSSGTSLVRRVIGAVAVCSAVLSPTATLAASPEFVYAIGFSSTTSSEITALTRDPADNIIVAGYYFGQTTIGGVTLGPPSDYHSNFYVAKFTPAGTLLWIRVGTPQGGTPSGGGEGPYGIRTDNAGNIFVAGAYQGALTLGGVTLPDVSPNQDAFFAKYSPSGDLLWAKAITGNYAVIAQSVAADASGNCVVTGQFAHHNYGGYADFAPGVRRYTTGGNDIFIAKYSGADGSLIWVRQAGGTGTGVNGGDNGIGVAVAPDQSIVVGGYYSSDLNFGGGVPVLPHAGNRDGFVAKLDPGGNPLWARSIGNGYLQMIYSVATDSTGAIYASGVYQTQLTIGGASMTTPDHAGLLVKLSAAGDVVWAKSFCPGPEGPLNPVVSTGSSDQVMIAARMAMAFQMDGRSFTPLYDAPTLFLQFNSSGVLQWSAQARALRGFMAALSGGDVAAAGAFSSTGIFGVYSLQGASTESFVTRIHLVPDATAPVITPSITGPQGPNGWYTGPVTVNWNVADPDSGIASSSGCTTTVLTTATAGTTLTCSATNGDGVSSSASVTIRITLDPGATSTMRLLSGTLAGQAVSPQSRVITVPAGTSIVGSFEVEINSTYGQTAVMVAAATPTWGDHASSVINLGNFGTPVSGLTRTVPINLIAPATPGTYYIIAAFRGEFTAAQVLSCTNWSYGGSAVWNDGNDVAQWSAATIQTASASGAVLVDYLFPGAQNIPQYVPATAITVQVGQAAAWNGTGDARFLVGYASNLNAGDATINVTNSGMMGAGLQSGMSASITGSICVNVYGFAPDEQMVSCCSCPVTPNGLRSLSVNRDILSNLLTPATPTSIVIKLLASVPQGGSCVNSAANVTGDNLAGGVVAWGTSVHSASTPPASGQQSGPFTLTGHRFIPGTLHAGELSRLQQLCNFTLANGSGYGTCKSCQAGGLGQTVVEQ